MARGMRGGGPLGRSQGGTMLRSGSASGLGIGHQVAVDHVDHQISTWDVVFSRPLPGMERILKQGLRPVPGSGVVEQGWGERDW